MARQPKCTCGVCAYCRALESSRVYYRRNREKVLAQAKDYRERNREEILVKDRARHRSDDARAKRRARRRGQPQPTRDAWAEQNLERVTAARRSWKQRNPEKVRAHSLLAYHVRAGRIERQPCEVCGDPNTHGHHEDYADKLGVRWLCPKHHAEAHWLPDEVAA